MTHLEAELHDFTIVLNDENEVTHWRFRFGKCEDFRDTLEEFKNRINKSERKPYPNRNWIWEVKASLGNYRVMQELFDNFIESEHAARSQTRMF